MWAVYTFYPYKFVGYLTVIAYWLVIVMALMKVKDLMKYKRYADYLYLFHLFLGFLLTIQVGKLYLFNYLGTLIPLILMFFDRKIGPGKVAAINFIVISAFFFPGVHNLKHVLVGL